MRYTTNKFGKNIPRKKKASGKFFIVFNRNVDGGSNTYAKKIDINSGEQIGGEFFLPGTRSQNRNIFKYNDKLIQVKQTQDMLNQSTFRNTTDFGFLHSGYIGTGVVNSLQARDALVVGNILFSVTTSSTDSAVWILNRYNLASNTVLAPITLGNGASGYSHNHYNMVYHEEDNYIAFGTVGSYSTFKNIYFNRIYLNSSLGFVSFQSTTISNTSSTPTGFYLQNEIYFGISTNSSPNNLNLRRTNGTGFENFVVPSTEFYGNPTQIVELNDKIYLYGATNDTLVRYLIEFDPITNTFTKKQTTNAGGTYMKVVNEKIVVYGINSSYITKNTYNLETNSWTYEPTWTLGSFYDNAFLHEFETP